MSFMLALSPRSAYMGGGTTYDVLASEPLHLEQGQVCTFHADLYHTGNPILEGLRYLLVGFCYCDGGGDSGGGGGGGSGGRSGTPGTVGLDLKLIAGPPPPAQRQTHTFQQPRRERIRFPFACHSFPPSFPGFHSGERGGSGGRPSPALLEAVRALAAMESSKFVRVDGGGGDSRGSSGGGGGGECSGTLLEALALEIYHYHADRLGLVLDDNGSHVVVEYWGQHLDGGEGEGIPLHFDKNEDLYRKTSQVANPYLSTVTYLTGGDASDGRSLPTIVFDPSMSTRPSDYNPRNQDRSATYSHTQADGDGGGLVSSDGDGAVLALVSYPKAGKHLSFDGELLHGVPSELRMSAATGGRSGEPERITFLVNIWLHRHPKSSTPPPQAEPATALITPAATMASAALPLTLPAGLAMELPTYPERAMPFIDIPGMVRRVANGEDSFLLTLQARE